MSKLKVLIIDDEAALAGLIKKGLEALGEFLVETETKGVRAVETAQKFKPDLVLLDMRMPHVDGATVVRMLMDEESTTKIPIAFLTGTIPKVGEGDQGYFIGGFPVLAKPVGSEELAEFIRGVLKRSKRAA